MKTRITREVDHEYKILGFSGECDCLEIMNHNFFKQIDGTNRFAMDAILILGGLFMSWTSKKLSTEQNEHIIWHRHNKDNWTSKSQGQELNIDRV